MRAVIQRVLEASVSVAGETKGAIQQGLLVYLGLVEGDTEVDEDYMVEKISQLRIFADPQGKMNLSLLDVGGGVLLISQFTLCADARKGRRPSFSEAAKPDFANLQYEKVQAKLRAKGLLVEIGVFQADMQVKSINDGPVTILLDSRKAF